MLDLSLYKERDAQTLTVCTHTLVTAQTPLVATLSSVLTCMPCDFDT